MFCFWKGHWDVQLSLWSSHSLHPSLCNDGWWNNSSARPRNKNIYHPTQHSHQHQIWWAVLSGTFCNFNDVRTKIILAKILLWKMVWLSIGHQIHSVQANFMCTYCYCFKWIVYSWFCDFVDCRQLYCFTSCQQNSELWKHLFVILLINCLSNWFPTILICSNTKWKTHLLLAGFHQEMSPATDALFTKSFVQVRQLWRA